ncbi:TPM domain-containing protein [Microbacterium arabinogalactanolyticum]|uniref:TPM domain-containing protein n=1 Tax=Microbacterium arabinogalactanolyticum TaxID=69365 RepID=UPI002556AF11|nr:TPM domain-containing protein [Microbacterium arabinogalactanolyticum]GLC85285.1 hypothetical protein MIAR_18720 [Microbacterium arabinogalactanolyticum]
MRGPWGKITAVAGAITLAAGLALSGALLSGGAASAATPPDLDPGFVTDASGVLGDAAEARLEKQLGDLAAKEGRPELYVILVPDFEDPGNALAWADATALRNNLAPDQYLLAIATEGRTLAISAEYGGDGVQAGPLSEDRILQIEDHLGGDYLADDDWEGGISYVAGEFDRVPWPWWVWVLGVAALALIVFGVTRLVLHLRRRAAAAAELRTLEGQKKRAARLLVLADEAVRTSEQELGFVTAEFGEETTAEFTTVLKECRTRLDGGFQLLQKLEDSTEDTPAETRAWTDEIIRMCAQTDRDLDGRKQQLASLRALAEGSAATLTRLRTARAEATGIQQDAAERLAVLTAAFPPAALVGVAGNPAEIGRRLAATDAQLAALEKAVQAHKPSAISQAVHEIERLLAEAGELRDAVKAQADALAAGTAAPGQTDADPLELAKAAVRAAEASVQARPGEVNALALTRLNLAKRQLAAATASGDAQEAARLAATASSVAAQVQALTGAPAAPAGARFSRSAADDGRTERERPVMYDEPSSRQSWQSIRAASSSDDEGRGGKAIAGALGGGLLGLVGGFSLADGSAGLIILFVVLGAVFGALSGAFGGNGGGGSSSGWGGSSHSSWGGSSRSSRSSSSRSFSSRSSGGSRSSGRSGGRRF